jgi:hypothetical protein
MPTIQFNYTTFQALFPAFASSPSQTILQYNWNDATNYLSDKTMCGWYSGMNLNQQTQALNLMTAHLTALGVIIAANSTPGLVVGATIDKISVTIQPPPAPNQWQWWLNQTPYGQQLLALLKIVSAGGRFFNGAPVFTAFRR